MKIKVLHKATLFRAMGVLSIFVLTILPLSVHPGHAASTLVCLSSTTDSCPSSPAVFTGPVGSIIKVHVVIANAASFNGFQVWLGTYSSTLNTTSIDLAGSILPGPRVSLECINGHGCEFWLGSGPGTDALYASGSSSTGSNGNATGLLFTVNYRILATGSGVPLELYWQVSPSGWDASEVEVSFATGGTLVPVQNGTFNSCAGCPGSGNVSLQQTVAFRGITASITGSLEVNGTTETLTGTVNIQAVNDTTGAVIFSGTFSIYYYFGAAIMVKFVMVIPSTPVSLGAICSIDKATYLGSCMLARNPDPARYGSINIIDLGMLAVRFGGIEGSANYMPSLDLAADGSIDIIDVGIESVNFGAPVFY